MIPPQFNGPSGLGNGGYVAGMLARRIGGDAEVRLSRGFPLGVPLTLCRDHEDNLICLLGDQELGRARAVSLNLDVPPPPTLEMAHKATSGYRFLHRSDPRGCYVCSPWRASAEGLRLFCGPVTSGSALAAAVWRPEPRWAEATGEVAVEHVWGALDCPGGYAIEAAAPGSGIYMLGSCTGSIRIPLAVEECYLVSSWEIAPGEGRKRFMGVAIHDVHGRLRACASQIWIWVAPAKHAA